jgi:hypothetical protein
MGLVFAVFQRLTQLGFSVFFNECLDNVGDDLQRVRECHVFLFLGNQQYQKDANCMLLLREAKVCASSPAIVPVFVEKSYLDWCLDDLTYLCQLKSETSVNFDISEVIEEWSSNETGLDPTESMIQSLSLILEPLSAFLKEKLLHCSQV